MFRRPRLKSKLATLRSCKLLVLISITVLAMTATTDYLQQQQQQQQHDDWQPRSSRPSEPGIISAGCGRNHIHPTSVPLDHIPNDKLKSDCEYRIDLVAKWWQTALRSPFIVAHAIRLIRIEAPSSVEVGKPIKLRCLYELRGEKLQSLAWYKNGREFYRYQPFERRQPVLTFNLSGINVDMHRSRNSTVHLTNTTMETTGRYKCEATSTTFREAHQEVTIRVAEPEASGVPITTVSVVCWILPYLTATLSLIRGIMWPPNHERNYFYTR